MRRQKHHWLHAIATVMLLSLTIGYLCRPVGTTAGPQSAVPTKPVTTPKSPSAPTPQSPLTPLAKPSVTAEDLQRALARIDAATFLLIVVTSVVGALGLILALAGIGAVIFSRSVIRGWVNRQAREAASEETSKVIAQIWIALGYLEWARITPGEAEGLDLAARLGIKALEAATRAKDEEHIALAKSNISYYYAQSPAPDKKEIALEYAKDSRTSFAKFPKPLVLANNIFVRMIYSDCDQMADVKKDAEDLMNRFEPIREELKVYIDKMKEKCPALADGATG